MIKSVIKILVAIAIANALWRISTAYVSYYQFQDSVDELATHTTGTDDQLRGKVVELATKYDEPVDPDAISIEHTESHIYIRTSYVKPVNLFPGYEYQWPFNLKVDGIVIVPQRLGSPNSK